MVRQAWLLGLLNCAIDIGKGHNMMRKYAFCTYSLSSKGEEYIQAPHECLLPLAGVQHCTKAKGESHPPKDATRTWEGGTALPHVHVMPDLAGHTLY